MLCRYLLYYCNEWPSNDCIIIVLYCLSLSPHRGRLAAVPRREAGAAQWWSDPGPRHTAATSATLTPPPPGFIHITYPCPGNIPSSETSDPSWSPIHHCPYSIVVVQEAASHGRCVADIWPGCCSAATPDPGLAMDEIEQDLRGLRPAFVASQVHLPVVVVF